MKWIMALNEPNDQFKLHTKKYEYFAKIALYSAKINAPNLDPILIYNGSPNRFTKEMEELGVKIIFHKLSFENAIENVDERDNFWKQTAKGAFLRLDIPNIIETDETVLYTDNDIFFLKDPTNFELNTKLIAVSSEFEIDNFDKINTGTMLIELKEARKIFPLVINETKKNLNIIPDYDQGAIQIFLNKQWDRLHPYMNWKPYWGINENAIIIHFHGPKPNDFDIEKFILKGKTPIYNQLYQQSPIAYEYYLKKWLNLSLDYQLNLS